MIKHGPSAWGKAMLQVNMEKYPPRDEKRILPEYGTFDMTWTPGDPGIDPEYGLAPDWDPNPGTDWDSELNIEEYSEYINCKTRWGRRFTVDTDTKTFVRWFCKAVWTAHMWVIDHPDNPERGIILLREVEARAPDAHIYYTGKPYDSALWKDTIVVLGFVQARQYFWGAGQPRGKGDPLATIQGGVELALPTFW
jgi:hypothetical protein